MKWKANRTEQFPRGILISLVIASLIWPGEAAFREISFCGWWVRNQWWPKLPVEPREESSRTSLDHRGPKRVNRTQVCDTEVRCFEMHYLLCIIGQESDQMGKHCKGHTDNCPVQGTKSQLWFYVLSVKHGCQICTTKPAQCQTKLVQNKPI